MQVKFCLLALAILVLSCSAQYYGECQTPDFTSFCAEVVTAAPNHTIDGEINDYLGIIEGDLSLAWSSFTSTLSDYASRYDFTICQDCITALKLTFCASLVPSCGFFECYGEAIEQIENQCLPSYYSTTGSTSQCQSQCSELTTNPQAEAVCYLCEANCISGIILNSCMSYMMSRTMCANLLSVCACDTNQNDIDTVCQFFSDEGYTIPFPQGLTCSATENWCQDSDKKKRSTTQEAGVINVNQYVQFQVPQAIGQENIASPLISPGTQPPVSKNNSNMLVSSIGLALISAILAISC